MSSLKEFIEGMPKGENHIHFSGAIYPAWALEFGKRNNIELPFSTVEEAEKMYDFKNLDEFLVAYTVASTTIVTQDDYRDMIIKMGEDAWKQNILLREVMFTNSCFLDRGIPVDVVMNGFREGRKIVKEQYDVDMFFISDLDRMKSAEYSLDYVKQLKDYTDIISAVGLDYSEDGYPAYVHAESFKLAKEMGFVCTGHAGEDCGPESVWDSLNNCFAERIDHGVRAVEDPKLVKKLADEKIFLTVCPISNVLVNVFPDMEHHSVKQLYDAGIPLSINSDDPPFFFSNLIDNYLTVIDTFGLKKDDIYRLAYNSFAYSLADEGMKKGYIAKLDKYFAENDYQ